MKPKYNVHFTQSCHKKLKKLMERHKVEFCDLKLMEFNLPQTSKILKRLLSGFSTQIDVWNNWGLNYKNGIVVTKLYFFISNELI
jgi:hypothetical protein